VPGSELIPPLVVTPGDQPEIIPPLVITPDDDVDLIPPLVIERDDPVAPSTAPAPPVDGTPLGDPAEAALVPPASGSTAPAERAPTAPTPIPASPTTPPAPALPAPPVPAGSVGGAASGGGRDGGERGGPSAVLGDTATPVDLMFAGFVRLRSRAPAATDVAPLESPG
jgi:hypothetical protein